MRIKAGEGEARAGRRRNEEQGGRKPDVSKEGTGRMMADMVKRRSVQDGNEEKKGNLR